MFESPGAEFGGPGNEVNGHGYLCSRNALGPRVLAMVMDTNFLKTVEWTRTWSRRVTGVHQTLSTLECGTLLLADPVGTLLLADSTWAKSILNQNFCSWIGYLFLKPNWIICKRNRNGKRNNQERAGEFKVRFRTDIDTALFELFSIKWI